MIFKLELYDNKKMDGDNVVGYTFSPAVPKVGEKILLNNMSGSILYKVKKIDSYMFVNMENVHELEEYTKKNITKETVQVNILVKKLREF